MAYIYSTRTKSELSEMIRVANFLDSQGYLWCHVPNEIGSSRSEGHNLNMCGRKKGFPDILIFYPVNIAIELKRSFSSTVRDAQYAWIQNLQLVGWKARICFGAQDAIDFIRSCVSLRPPKKKKEIPLDQKKLLFGKTKDGITRQIEYLGGPPKTI